MENCPETRTLIQWLNGALSGNESSEIEEHVEKCEACHAKLLNLTDDFSLQPPPNPEDVLGHGDTFTNEPHFRSMRERLSKNVAKLKSDLFDPGIETDGPDGDLKNLAGVSIARDEIETIDANAASTQNSGQGESLTETLSPETIRIHGFLLESHIGSGGFANVFKAWEKELARPVAIKLLDKSRIDARNRHRFLREAKAASSVRSPHVVQVLSSGETDNGQPYIAMELIEGDTLAQWITKRVKNLNAESIEQGVKLLIQVCRGVQAVHDASLIHRDIKPGNIFVDSASSAAKLGDFGLIRILDEDTVTLTRAAELAGTPAYMSPEQTVANSDLDATSDVYGLGATLYQMLTGQPPFRGSSIAILKQVNEQQPLPPRLLNEHVSKDLETICLKALEKEPQRRYQSATLMAEDLQAALDGHPINARPVSGAGKAIRWAKRNRGLATSLALLLLTLATATTISTTLLFRATAAERQTEIEKLAAVKSAGQATKDRTAVLESLNMLIGKLHKDVGQQSGPRTKIQQTVIDAAFTGLNSIAKVSGDREADRTTMLLHRNLAELMDDTGNRERAEESYQTSLEIARELQATDPDSNNATFDLAMTLVDLAKHYNLWQYNREVSIELNDECESLTRSVLESDPDFKGGRGWSQLVQSHGIRWKELHYQMASDKIVEQAPEVLADVDRLLQTEQTDEWPHSRAANIKFELTRAYAQLGDFKNSLKYLEQSREHLTAALKWSPENSNLFEHLSVLDRFEALVATELSDHDRALEINERALAKLKELVAGDPDDFLKQNQLAVSFGMSHKPLLALGRYEDAIEASDEAIRIFTMLLNQTPGESQLLARQINALTQRAHANVLNNDWEAALSDFEAALKYATDPNYQPDDKSALAFTISNSKIHIAAMKLLLFESHDRPTEITPVTKTLVMSVLARAEAKVALNDQLSSSAIDILTNLDPEIGATTFDQLFESLNGLKNLPFPYDIYGVQFQARVSALRAQNLAEAADAPDSQEQRDQLIAESIKLLKKIAIGGAQFKTPLVDNEPDLIWLRKTEQYKSSGLAIQGISNSSQDSNAVRQRNGGSDGLK